MIVLPVQIEVIPSIFVIKRKILVMKLILIAISVAIVAVEAKKLEEKYSWQELEFAWPSEEIKQEAIKSGRYVESHNLPLGLEVWKDKFFITVPR